MDDFHFVFITLSIGYIGFSALASMNNPFFATGSAITQLIIIYALIKASQWAIKKWNEMHEAF